MSLYKFCLIKDLNDLYYKKFHIKKSILKIKKITMFFRDYGISNILLLEVFFSHKMVLITFFGRNISIVYLVLAGYDEKIIELFIIHE